MELGNTISLALLITALFAHRLGGPWFLLVLNMETESARGRGTGRGRKRGRGGRGSGRGRGTINQQSVVPAAVEGTREALVREVSECGYVISQIFLSLVSS